jgi:hypothetical protein
VTITWAGGDRVLGTDYCCSSAALTGAVSPAAAAWCSASGGAVSGVCVGQQPGSRQVLLLQWQYNLHPLSVVLFVLQRCTSAIPNCAAVIYAQCIARKTECFESVSALAGGRVVLSLMNHTNTVQCGARVSGSYCGRRGSG